MNKTIKTRTFVVLILTTILCLLCGLLLIGCADDSEQNDSQDEKVITGISLDTRNAKQDFYIGDTFSTLGLGIIVYYEDGTESLQLVSEETCTISEPSLDKIGTEVVYVYYADFMDEYYVNVSRIDGIELDVDSVQRDYSVGDTFSQDGLGVSLCITSMDASSDAEVISYQELGISEYEVEAPDLDSPGVKSVKVRYQYNESQIFEISYDVYVTPDVGDDSVIQFETVNGATLTLFITERSGSGSSNQDGEASGWYLLNRTDGSFDMQEIKVSYTASTRSFVFVDGEGFVTSFSSDGNLLLVTIDETTIFSVYAAGYKALVFGWEKAILSVYLDISGVKREYVVNDTFTYEGLKLMALYSDKTEEELTGIDMNVLTPDMTEVGVKTVNVTFETNGASIVLTYQIYCIPEVAWESNRLEFGYDWNGSGATLELFVTSRSRQSGTWGNDQYLTGWLLVKNSDGTYEMYEYDYYLGSDVVSYVYPDGAPDGVASYVDDPAGGYLVVEINGKYFAATDNNWWHYVLFGWQ